MKTETKLTTPRDTVIGQFYKVPCLILPEAIPFAGIGRIKSVPVLLPAHTDPELRADRLHYHTDLRFFPEYIWQRVTDAIATTFVHGAHNWLTGELMPVEYRRLKCKREAPVFPAARNRHGEKRFCAVESKHSQSKLDLNTMLCPHKGICVADSPVQIINGRAAIVCNGHGLAWDVQTGENVSRHCPTK